MREIQSLCLPEFSDAAFARQGLSVMTPVSDMLQYALGGMFAFVNSDPAIRLEGTYHTTKPLDASGRSTNLANALRRLAGYNLDAIEYAKYVIEYEHSGQGVMFPERTDPSGMDQMVLQKFLAHSESSFMRKEALPKGFFKAIEQTLHAHFDRMPYGPSRYLILQLMNITHKYKHWCIGQEENSWWNRYATRERAWLAERFVNTLREGPIANSISPVNPLWEEVLAQAKCVYEALLFYFVGLMVDGFYDHPFTKDLAEVLHNFHKHPILGIRKTRPDAWCMLVS
jgi:hypothetical protein